MEAYVFLAFIFDRTKAFSGFAFFSEIETGAYTTKREVREEVRCCPLRQPLEREAEHVVSCRLVAQAEIAGNFVAPDCNR